MFFVLSKIFWMLAAPISLTCVLAALALLCRLVTLRRTGNALAWSALVLLLLQAATPLGPMAAAALERRFPPHPELPAEIAGIVVLGGGVDSDKSEAWGIPVLTYGAGRLTGAATLAGRFPGVPVIYAGGYGALGTPTYTENDVARDLLPRLGIDPARVKVTTVSRNTYENQLVAREVAGDIASKPWILVTNALHMPRSVAIFRTAGWNVIPWPVDPLTEGPEAAWRPLDVLGTLTESFHASREWIGLVAYRLAGYTDTLLP
ncbi:YdcF family protein [Zavarzinia sp.]|uniref:YdcF family protein n=1 Tax=Zavarzinia sp. TaxID=2027920 RepID=UPI00356486F0